MFTCYRQDYIYQLRTDALGKGYQTNYCYIIDLVENLSVTRFESKYYVCYTN